MSDDYKPIDCSLHDQIEDYATRRQRVVVTHAQESGKAVSVEDVITDWVVRDGVEYLRTASGLEIRLDRLVSVKEG